MSRAVVLLGHGSRDAAGAREYLAVAAAIRARLAPLPVAAGVLEFAGPIVPSIEDAFARTVAGGATDVLALPVLLHWGVHGITDMPEQVAAARARYPGVAIHLARPLAGHPALLDLVDERCRAARAALGPAPLGVPPTHEPREYRRPPTVLLVGRGSTQPRANAELYLTARLFQERGDYPSVEVCFVSLAPPCVFAGLRRCVALGATSILVVPYFINTGLLVRRIAEQVERARLFYPAARIAMAPHFGPDSRVVAAALDRAREVWPALGAEEGQAGARALAAVEEAVP